MAGELSPAGRRLAIAELERIEQTLTQMSAWADGDSADRERCAILLEDAAKCVMAVAFLLERVDRVRLGELMHRRMTPAHQAADGQQG